MTRTTQDFAGSHERPLYRLCAPALIVAIIGGKSCPPRFEMRSIISFDPGRLLRSTSFVPRHLPSCKHTRGSTWVIQKPSRTFDFRKPAQRVFADPAVAGRYIWGAVPVWECRSVGSRGLDGWWTYLVPQLFVLWRQGRASGGLHWEFQTFLGRYLSAVDYPTVRLFLVSVSNDLNPLSSSFL